MEYTITTTLNQLSLMGDEKREEYNRKLVVDDNQLHANNITEVKS